MDSQMKQAYMVISDVHLGGKTSNHKEFCHFLEWVLDLANKPKTIKYGDNEVIIQSPDKIILLGDILELWDPKDGDRYNIIKDFMKPFYLLSDIDCDKIYVLGNHDGSLGELDGEINNITLEEGTKFYIYDECYPEKGEKTCLKIGNRSYVFIHGHQFDKLQAVTQYINRFWNPLRWFQDVFNITFTKKHWRLSFIIFLCLLFVGKYSLWIIFLRFSLFGVVLWAILTCFFALSSIPGIVAYSQRSIYNTTKPSDKTVEQVIKKGYYQKNKETQDADIVVFGHTHFASSYEFESEKKLFLNSGCWVGTDTDFNGKTRYSNTFLYLDESGSYILTWRGDGKIDCIEAFT